MPQVSNLAVMAFQGLMILFLGGAILSTGVMNRLCLLGALICYFFVFAYVEGLETNRRKTFLIPMFLTVFLLSPNISEPWDSSAPYWPIWALKLGIAQIYVSAAIQKIKHSGVSWTKGGHLTHYLLWLDLFEDIPQARYAIKSPRLLHLMSAIVLIMQLTFWVILIVPQTLFFYACFGLAFHIAVSYTHLTLPTKA